MTLRIISSTLNLAPKHAALWTVAQHREALHAAGYSGTTYYPLNNMLAAQIKAGVDASDIIAAFQQPWREDSRVAVVSRCICHVVTRPHSIKAAGFDAAMNLAMPHLDHGLAVIERIQKHLGSELLRPVVVHPQGQMLGDALADPDQQPRLRRSYTAEKLFRKVGELQWQPTVEWAQNRSILCDNPAELADRMVATAQREGLGRAAFDANHAQAERQGLTFKDPVAIAARLAISGQLGAFEFSLQPNLGGDINDLRKVMDNNIERTPQGEMLAAAAQSTAPREDFMLRVEIPAYAYQQIGYSDYQQAHHELVPMLSSFMAEYLPG